MKRLRSFIFSVLTAAVMLSGSSCSLPFSGSSRPDETTVTTVTSASSVTTADLTAETTTAATSAESVAAADTSSSEAEESLPEYEFVMPVYSGEETVELNGNKPCFAAEELVPEECLVFSELDELGRCGAAFCCVGKKFLPTEERGPIGMVKPAGWHTVKYRNVDGKYLYNRCHLIAFELCGANAEERNLITGTRWLNIEGMLPTENRIRRFVEETGIHVLYRVTPRYEGDELLARGVEIEALSVEDGGEGICLHFFAFNIQPGIVIDWLTGDSYPVDPEDAKVEEYPDESADNSSEAYVPPEGVTYILNTSSHRFHLPGCQGVQDMKPKNREEFYGDASELLEMGYKPCGTCKPLGDDSEKVS